MALQDILLCLTGCMLIIMSVIVGVMNAMVFGQKFQKLRKEAGFSQEDLADKSGVSRGVIQQIEKGQGNPGLDSLIALGKILKYDFLAGAPMDSSAQLSLIDRVVESLDAGDPLKVASLLPERFAAAPPGLRALVLAYLLQDFSVVRKYRANIDALKREPKVR
jgi:transcriptional regulator with XRE-family HTH domain